MKIFIKRHLLIIITLSISVLLFSLSFPGLFNQNGLAFISFIALIPMFLVIFRLNKIEIPIYGFLYGMGKYLLFNYWFKSFDPAASAVAPGIHGVYYLVLFILFRFLFNRFPKFGYLPIAITWVAYEVFKSTDIVGYSYGILAQTMYKTPLFTGVLDIIGSYNLSLLIIFPGLLFAFMISTPKENRSKKAWIVPLVIYVIIMITAIIYTQLSKVDYSKSKTLRITLVQHNLNCWLSQDNPDLYAQAYDHLEALSKKGEEKGAQLVVWPETAFVPAIEWHKKYRPKDERDRYDLIMRLEKYLRSTNALYIIGNNESFNESELKPQRDKQYNTAYLYDKDIIISKYRKMNLVPFTESFPHPELFPWLYEYVKKLGNTQTLPGKEQTLFDIDGIKSTVLICYEDTFTDLPREATNNGSDLMINITNDAWTNYSSAALQHLAAASLRTIENRRSLVRAGTSGFTGIIDPNGKILTSLPLFTKGEITYDVPIYHGHKTFYTKHGKFMDNISSYLFLIIMLIALMSRVNDKKRKHH